MNNTQVVIMGNCMEKMGSASEAHVRYITALKRKSAPVHNHIIYAYNGPDLPSTINTQGSV